MFQKHITNLRAKPSEALVKCVQQKVESLRLGKKKWSFRCEKRNDHFYKILIISYLQVAKNTLQFFLKKVLKKSLFIIDITWQVPKSILKRF